MKIPDSHPAAKYQHAIATSVTRAREIVQGILMFGRQGGREARVCDVSLTAKEAMKLVRPITPDGVTLEERFSDAASTVLADPSQLIQVLLNLCTNGIQSMSTGGGRLEVATRNVSIESDEARILGVSSGPFVEILVRDDGQGMDEYTRSRMFEPFYTTHEPGKGTGLGLSVVHGIVTQHKGGIAVESEVGVGTTFRVYLPIASTATVAFVEDDATTSPELEGSESLLLVDDELEILESISASLEAFGYTSYVATDADEAMRVLASESVDILITDQTMPGLQGTEVASRARQDNPELIVVLMSGADQQPTEAVDLFLRKPFSNASLMAAIRRLVAAKRERTHQAEN